MNIDLEFLGVTKEQITDRVVDQIVEQTMRGKFPELKYDHEIDELVEKPSAFAVLVQEKIETSIAEAVEKIATKHVVPSMEDFIENFCLQKTNSWGEKVGEPVTFTEYLVQRCDQYMNEPVNYEGKTKGESRGGMRWNKNTDRMTFMIERHLQYSIDNAIKTALKDFNTKVAASLGDSVGGHVEKCVRELNKKLK